MCSLQVLVRIKGERQDISASLILISYKKDSSLNHVDLSPRLHHHHQNSTTSYEKTSDDQSLTVTFFSTARLNVSGSSLIRAHGSLSWEFPFIVLLRKSCQRDTSFTTNRTAGRRSVTETTVLPEPEICPIVILGCLCWGMCVWLLSLNLMNSDNGGGAAAGGEGVVSFTWVSA